MRLLAASGLLILALAAAGCGSAASLPSKTSNAAVDALITAGKASQEKGQPRQAASLYAKAVADDPTNAVALYDLGDLDQVAFGKDAAAEAAYQRALVVDPRFVDARFNLAILQSARRPASAIADYKTIIGIDPDDADAYLNLGFLLRASGRTAESAIAFHDAVTLDPGLRARMSRQVSAK